MAWVHVKADGLVAAPAFYKTEEDIDKVLETGDLKIEVPNNDIGNATWGDIEPGYSYDAARTPRFSVEVEPPSSGVAQAQYEAQETVNQIRIWIAEFNKIGHYYPVADVNKGLDWLHYGEIGMSRVMLSTHWTIDKRADLAKFTRYGSANITKPQDFLDQATSIAVPTSAVIWRDPATGAAWTLASAVANTAGVSANFAAEPSRDDLISQAWISSIPDDS